MRLFRNASLGAAAASMLAACVSGPAPQNYASARWAPGQYDASDNHPEGKWHGDGNSQVKCLPNRFTTAVGRAAPLEELRSLILAEGDRLNIEVLGDPDFLTGLNVVDSDGHVSLSGNIRIRAVGRDIGTFESELRTALIRAGLVRPLANAVRVRLAEASSVQAFVSGAVFEPGMVRAGVRRPETRIGQKEGEVTGDANYWRTLTAALRAAGGVRPDADLSQLVLVRGDRRIPVDISGIQDGAPIDDPLLAPGDRIIVPESGCFDESLVRPLPITQPGIKVYLSNLTRSANNNAGAAISADTGSLPYGSRLLQALFAMNCVGGTFMQADRRAVLVSRNPSNGQSIAIEREIEDLVRLADRDEANPYLMPGDAVACYDSKWTNFREALGLVGDLANTATPAILLDRAVR